MCRPVGKCVSFSSVQSFDRLGRRGRRGGRGIRDDSAEIVFQSFMQRRSLWAVLARAGMSTLRCCPSIISSTASPTFQGALKDGFGEAVVACDMLEPCKLPSHDSCQKRFLWTHKAVDLAPHPVVGLVLQVGDVEKFRKPGSFFIEVQIEGSTLRSKPRRP